MALMIASIVLSGASLYLIYLSKNPSVKGRDIQIRVFTTIVLILMFFVLALIGFSHMLPDDIPEVVVTSTEGNEPGDIPEIDSTSKDKDAELLGVDTDNEIVNYYENRQFANTQDLIATTTDYYYMLGAATEGNWEEVEKTASSWVGCLSDLIKSEGEQGYVDEDVLEVHLAFMFDLQELTDKTQSVLDALETGDYETSLTEITALESMLTDVMGNYAKNNDKMKEKHQELWDEEANNE